MKKYLVIFLCALSVSLFGQIHNPVQWKTSVKHLKDTEYVLIAKATIESGWHLYSQNVPDDGPIPTTFSFVKNEKLCFGWQNKRTQRAYKFLKRFLG